MIFEVSDDELLEITTDMFVGSQSWFEAQVPAEDPGPPPLDPALLVDEAIAGGVLANYTAPADNEWEAVPFGSTGAYDHYQRPIYRDMTFENVRIPKGNNGLFVNCTFVGVTFIEAESGCEHQDWNYAGAVEPADDGDGRLRLPAPLPRPAAASARPHRRRRRGGHQHAGRTRTTSGSRSARSSARSRATRSTSTRTGETRCRSPVRRGST